MCDPMDEMNESFDFESQLNLLQAAETQVIEAVQVVDIEADENERDTRGRRAFQMISLVIRSTLLFKLRANCHSDDDVTSSISSTSNYTAVCSSPHDHDSGIVPDLEDSTESAQDTSSTAHSATQHGEPYYDDIQQRVQTKNIAEIVKQKNLDRLNNLLGGVGGVAKALNSDLCNGISNPQTNICHHNSTQLLSQYLITFYHSFLGACRNFTIFLLFFAAILSLTFGIKEQGLNINGWFDGAVVILTILVLVIFATVRNFFEEMRSQRKLENYWQLKGGKMEVSVVREGACVFVSVIDLRVGDVVILRKGDQVLADGVFVSGQALELVDNTTIKPTIIDENNPFLFCGSRVISGNGRMIVTSIGMDTVWGEMMSGAIQSTDKKCTVVACLHKLNTCIQIVGLSISILIILVLFLRYKAGKLDDENGYKIDNKGEPTQVNAILDAIKGIISTASKGTARKLTTLLSISLLGVMDGLPFVISFAIIIWNRKTLAFKASERDYLACVKMASVTTICTDKFGGLTEHEKVINWLFIGEELVCESSVVASDVLEDICDGIGSLDLLSSTECKSKVLPLVTWAETKLGMKTRSFTIMSSEGSNPYQECCRALIKKTGNDGQKKYLLHLIGPPQDILAKCSGYSDIKGTVQTIDKRRMFDQVTQHMLSEAQVIGFACKCVQECDVASTECDVASIEDDNCSFTFRGMVGLKDAKMEDTKGAILTLKEGGIRTILTSGEDVSILQTIGQNCGIVSDSDDLVLTGEEFRCDEDRMVKLDKICIIGNCLPSDKILLIRCLKQKGDVVALLGQKTIDAPALRKADIGITFGTWSSEVARESCDISIRDGDFNFLRSVIENSRCFHENIRKFIQLELIITISSSLINLTATLVLGDAPITVIQLFWLNLVVSLVGGLALLTGPSTEKLMTMLPDRYSSGKLITKAMWRNIAIQASYQTTILVTLQRKGNAILGESKVKSMVYNAFFLCQIVNKFIARMPEKKNIFAGLFQKNRWFLVALVLLLMCQAVFAVAEKVLGNNPGLNWELWGVCLSIGLICWLLDMAGKTASDFINSLPKLSKSEN